MSSNNKIKELKLRERLIDKYTKEYEEVDKEFIDKMIDIYFEQYRQLDELLSAYSPRQFHYFVHEKTGVVRIIAPKDPDFMETQYLPGDDTPMVLATFDRVRSQYPSQIEHILTHPRVHRAPEGPGRKIDEL